MIQDFKYAELTSAQKHFLTNYSPKDDSFTTTLEMKQIISKLGLDEGLDVEQLRAIRNSVVRFYSILIKNADSNRMSSLQSVTAVIDLQMYKLNSMSV